MPKERKQSIWSRGRIDKLIELYQKHECLWNPFDDFYKHKAKRNKAIESICMELNVSKPDYAKKIHNLRNQFNSELKKYEKLLEENEELEGDTSNEYQCRWVHYQPLMFLKDVITPRPGTKCHPSKTSRLETKHSAIISSDDIYIEETNLDDDNDDGEFGGFEEQDSNTKGETRNIIATVNPTVSPRLYSSSTCRTFELKHALPQQSEMQAAGCSTQLIASGTAIELNTQSPSVNISAKNPTIVDNKFEFSDQWSAFGKFIANELRNYHSETSRRKLKRKIMQAMLEIAEEDDDLAAGKLN